MQAGSSEDGKAFAARYAEAVFTAQQTIEDAQAFYGDLKSRTAAVGRDPEHIKVLPGIVPVLGSTEAEARAAERVLEDHIVYTHGVGNLERLLQLEPGILELDAPLPDGLPPESAIEGAKSRYTLVVELARREGLTVRELIGRLGGGRGHLTFAGTPEQVADKIETWFTRGARRRRLQHHARGPAVRPRRLRRPRRPDPARPRSAPHRVRPAPDPAGPLRPAEARQPARHHARTRPRLIPEVPPPRSPAAPKVRPSTVRPPKGSTP